MIGDGKGIDCTEALNKAIELCYTLRLQEAECALEAIINASPSSTDAYSALALIKLMQARPDQQKRILDDALMQDPRHYPSLHQMAVFYYREGQFNEAYSYIERAIAQQPSNSASLLLASRLCLLLGDQDQATSFAQTVFQQSKGWHPTASTLMAQALIDGKDPSSACADIVELLISGQGNHVILEAACILIPALQVQEQYLFICEDRLSLSPDNMLLRILRVRLLASLGKNDECFPDLYYLLSLEQNNLAVLNCLAEALLCLKKHRESLQLYIRMARINGTNPTLLNQIGVCYRGISHFRSAEKAFWRSVRKNPLDPLIIGNLGEINFRFGQFTKSIELYTIALNLSPTLKQVFYNKMLAYSVGSAYEIQAMLVEATKFWDIYRNTHAVFHAPPTECCYPRGQLLLQESVPSKLVRIGILTSDIGNHCVSFFLASFLKHYSRDRFHVELILCDRRYEAKEREICSFADHAFSLDGLSETESREAIRAQQYDIIIECNGYTGGSGISLLAERCAPIQCHYIGYHASTGLNTIDYFISDRAILPEAITEQLSEKPLRLDRAWLAFTPFEQFPQAESTATVSRPLLGFYGNSTKITNLTLQYWSALFAECLEAILVLKCLSYQDPYVAERVLSRVESCGIQRHRIAIIPPSASWKEHLEYYNLVDYALDSSPWSSATTGFESLAMGVPLLAIQGKTIASRMSSSLVFHLGHQDWISKTPSDYASWGHRISKDFIQVRQMKAELQSEVLSSSLFDGPDMARSLQKVLLQALEQHESFN